MEALNVRRRIIFFTILLFIAAGVSVCQAASYQTRNFSVSAERAEIAEQVGLAAEEYRRQLAVFWLGQPLPNWSKPCRLRVREGRMGAGGQTTFQFVRGEVLNWDMSVQGSLERILDSVLPHEINHTIFACHFRRPLPRWADEGAATLFEHRSEQLKQLTLLNEVINNDRECYSLQQLLSMKEYPNGMRPMLILYAQGFALADFLVQQRGRKAYLQLLADGEKIGWEEAIRRNFDHQGIESLEKNWRGWVLAGMPKLTTPKDQMLADIPQQQSTSRVSLQIQQVVLPHEPGVVRSQSPDPQHKRRSTIQAPIPKGADMDKGSRTPATQGIQSATADQADGNSQAQSGLRQLRPLNVATDANIVIPTAPPAMLELTAAAVELSGSVQQQGMITDFENIHLPKERDVVSGSTPVWAGFPGQKKLF